MCKNTLFFVFLHKQDFEYFLKIIVYSCLRLKDKRNVRDAISGGGIGWKCAKHRNRNGNCGGS